MGTKSLTPAQVLAAKRAKHAARMARYRRARRENPLAHSAAIGGELEPLRNVVMRELLPHGVCCLCGNCGVIDTVGKVFSPMGKECGARVYCICPNGRPLMRVEQDHQ